MNKKGFTLVELVIAMCVMAIIACIAVPALRSAMMRANDAAAIAALRVVSQAQNQKYITSGQYNTLSQLSNESFVDIRFKPTDSGVQEATYSGFTFKIFLIAPPTSDDLPNYVLSAKPTSTSILTKSGSKRCGIDNRSVIYCDQSDIENHFETAQDLSYGQPISENN